VRELTDLELDILKILADNKGHALWDLAERLGKEKSNLILTLNRLEDKIELSNPYGIGCYDITDTNSLGLKFQEPKDPLSRYIRRRFRPDTIRLMDSNIDNFSLYVYFEFEKILNDPNLFNEKRFAHIALSEKIQDLIQEKPKGQNLRYLNRLLLEEAYPNEILKSQNPIIYKGMARKTTNPDSRQPKHHELPYFISANYLVLRFLIVTLDLAYNRYIPQISKKVKDELEYLGEQVEWKQISENSYKEIERELYCDCHDAASLQKAQEKHKLLDDFLSSQYVLQFVNDHGFKILIYEIHDMVRSWDRCWALGERAVKSGIINDEADLECAEKLIRLHQSVEEGFREQDRRMKKMMGKSKP